MRTKTPFSPQNDLLRNSAIAFFDKLAQDPLAGRVFSYAVNWPQDTHSLTDRLGNYAAVGTYKRKRGKPIVLAQIISPAVNSLLDILVPALCQRNPEPFKLFAKAIEAAAPTKSKDGDGYPVRRLDGYPVHSWQYVALTLALRISAKSKAGVLPVTETTLRRKVEKLTRNKIDAGYFHHECDEKWGLRFRKDPKSGGRPRKF